MKTPLPLCLCLSLAALALASSAQEGGPTIHAAVTYHPDGTRSATVADPEKGTTEETVTDKSGKVLRKVTYLLDERGQPLGSITSDGKGTILYRASYKRDGVNRVDEEDISTPDGQLMRRRVYTYGAQNKVTNITEYDAAGNMFVMPRKDASPGRPDKKKR